MPSGYMKVVMGSKKPKANFLGRYCMLQSWPDYSDPTVSLEVSEKFVVVVVWKVEHVATVSNLNPSYLELL